MRKVLTLLLAALIWASQVHAEPSPPEFLAEAAFDSATREVVITVTTFAEPVAVFQLSIPRPWADEAGIQESNDFARYVIPYDDDAGPDDRAKVDHANKSFRLYRGRIVIRANSTAVIRLPAKSLPSASARLLIGGKNPAATTVGTAAVATEIKGTSQN